MSGTSARAIVEEILGRGHTRAIWSADYQKVLPISVQDFDLSAVLPAVLYMFRFGHRRGKGRFVEVFGGESGSYRERRRQATIDRVAEVLSNNSLFEGFSDETTRAILGDLLLCFCLENRNRELGRREQVQRVAPAHYLASWIDLPESVVNLRYVPETMVAVLAEQEGPHVAQTPDGDRTWFPVARGFEDNVLLKAFAKGIRMEGGLGDRAGDRFDESTQVGLDQLLMVRLAQQLGVAPDKLRGGEGERIPNQRPIAARAARYFSEDIRRFVREYAEQIPRHALVEMLESCVALGLTTILLSVVDLVFAWAESGTVPPNNVQRPVEVFVDCSNGLDRGLRYLAEQSMEDVLRRLERFPVVLMALRLLDYAASHDRTLRRLAIATRPDATEWVNLLGELLFERREEARAILYDLDRRGQELADAMQDEYPDAAAILTSDEAVESPVWRLAEALTYLQGRKNTLGNLNGLLDACLMVSRPNGLAAKRKVSRTAPGRGRRTTDARSLILTDAVLDYLVHLHILRPGRKGGARSLAFREFLEILYERYGLCVDRAPPGMAVSNEDLQRNKAVLERRLRDLGLLIGVNDAEAMKRLVPRFQHAGEGTHDLD
ncbi:hypothetical protein [Deferrisoma camini]|uniref:hypothetical protein n=1 Tax=Deferrisoma camini TaxID=1035120 RepID=UPI0004B2351D|nr:hypothetical protein [Deferrisoma camini]